MSRAADKPGIVINKLMFLPLKWDTEMWAAIEVYLWPVISVDNDITLIAQSNAKARLLLQGAKLANKFGGRHELARLVVRATA